MSEHDDMFISAIKKFLTWAIRPCEDYPDYTVWIAWGVFAIACIIDFYD